MSKSLLKAGALIDVVAERVEHNMGVLLEDSIIQSIKPFDEFTEACEVIDYSDKTLMPGLFNCHVHMDMDPTITVKQFSETNEVERIVFAYQQMAKFLDTGFTYIRNLGSKNCIDLKLKRLVDAGKAVGPSICASGDVICMTGGHGWFTGLESDGVAEVMKNTRYLLKQGVDVVKIMATGGVMTEGVEPGSPQLTLEEMKASVEEARKAGRTTASHAQGAEGILNAVRAGISSIEHGIYLTDEIIDLMLEQGTYMVPTLAAVYFIVTVGEKGGIPRYAVEKAEKVMNAHIASFKEAYRRGVKIAMGTDAGTPFNLHESSWFEFKLMIEHGMRPMDALKSGTINAAELLNVSDHYGSLQAGKKADIIVLDENPLTSIETLEHVTHVYKHGVQVK